MVGSSKLNRMLRRGGSFFFSLCLAALIFSFVGIVPQKAYAASDLYVAATGSDSNPGTSSQPFLTILKASQAATPGSTIHVAPGTYVGSFQTTKSGTADARIRYVSDVKWGARLVPPVVNSRSEVWDNQGSYVDIEGFEVDGNGSNTRNGLYNEGSYVSFKNNHVHDIATNIPCTGSGGAAINTDYFHYGIETEISGNVVHDIGYAGCSFIQAIYVSTTGTVKNNLVYNNGGAGIHLWHDVRDVTIANNTVVNNWIGIVVGGGDFWHTQGPADNIHVSNNIVYNNTFGIDEVGKTGLNNTYTNNLVYQNETDWLLKNGLTHTGTIAADPQFVYFDAAGVGDYHLKYTSPAIDAGLPTDAPSIDLDGNIRPLGGGIDIGTYEYDPDTFTLNAVSRKLVIGETTQLISASDLSGAQYVSDNPNVATVDGNGLVTAVANGVASLTATITNGTSSKTSTVQISVATRLHSVTLHTDEPIPEMGQTQQYTVTGLMSDGNEASLNQAEIRYYFTSTKVASVDAKGLVTGVSSGTDTLNVNVTLDGVTKKASTQVTIAPPTISSVALTASNDTLVKGQFAQLTVTATSTNGRPASLKTAAIAYRSGNPAVATVNASGLITAVAPGTADISADVTLDGITHSATMTITIQPGIAVLYQFTSMPIIAKTATATIYASSSTLQFEAVTEGASITFGLDVPETHLYGLSLKSFKATSYGNYAINIDGEPLSEYNFYGTTGKGTAYDPIGSIQLTKGVHQLTFKNIGKNPESTNYKMGVIELQLLAHQDVTPPATAANVQGMTNNGWYTSDVQVSLSAVDTDTGVSRTEYRLDDAPDWTTYTTPIALSADGKHELYYRSIDEAGNVEQTKTEQINIDQTAPVLTILLDKTSIWPPDHKIVSIHALLNASDAASGVSSVILTSITSNEPDSGLGDIQANIGSTDTSFNLRAERLGEGTGRIYTITYTVSDNAGHQTEASATVSVPHDQSVEMQ